MLLLLLLLPPTLHIIQDMNWMQQQGSPSLPSGWVDVWPELKHGAPGYTYDGVRNGMLRNSLKSRMDRCVGEREGVGACVWC